MDGKPRPHAIMISVPFQGHINPFVNLALKLASNGFSITFVHTEFVHQTLSKAHNNNKNEVDFFSEARESGLDICYTTINDGFPVEFDRVIHLEEYSESILRDFPARVDEFIERRIKSDPFSTHFIVADTSYSWPATIAKKYNLVNLSFWTEPALMFSLIYHLDFLRENGHCSCKDNIDEEINYLPGVESISTKDIMPYLKESESKTIVYRALSTSFQLVKNADFILHNTIQELEPTTLSSLNKSQPNYAIGPINFSKINLPTIITKSLWSESNCANWLDSKPPNSVLYVSFGSLVQTNKQIGVNLCDDGLTLLVDRFKVAEKVRSFMYCGCDENMGLKEEIKKVREVLHGAMEIGGSSESHINPFVNLALKLASNGFSITFVHTEFVHQTLSKAHNNNINEVDFFSEARESGLDIRYTKINDGFPVEFDRDILQDEYWESILRDFPARVDEFIERRIKSDPFSTHFIVVDTSYSWPATIAKKYNLNVSFWTEPALVFSLIYHLDLLRENGHCPCKVESISTKDIMPYLKESESKTIVYRALSTSFQHVKNAYFILHNTIQELEPTTLSSLNKNQPNYAIGPINFSKINLPTTITKSLWSESSCANWLDSKPPNSVLYVSFGSLVQTNKQVIEEIAHGLLLIDRFKVAEKVRSFMSGSDENMGLKEEIKKVREVLLLVSNNLCHITPFINLSIKLASKNFSITFVHLEFIHHKLSQNNTKTEDDLFSEARESGLDIRYTTISDGFPLEFDRHSDEYWDTMLRDFPARVDEFVGNVIKSDPNSVHFLVTDTLFTWPATIAKK
ncbi:hypothetical protein ACJIZ3_024279 [Penstemon smallii]|uniref:Uncharacterized protein n=1 Tax=Penstemon smallii TaxID=265156 RepID=A0ABD3TUI8_9LAMI